MLCSTKQVLAINPAFTVCQDEWTTVDGPGPRRQSGRRHPLGRYALAADYVGSFVTLNVAPWALFYVPRHD